MDPLAGTIFVSDEDATASLNGAVIRVDPIGGEQTLVASNPDPADPTGFKDPVDVALERTTGKLVVADEDADSEPIGSDERGAIFRVDPLSGETVPVTSAGSLVDPTGVSVGVNGGLLVSEPLGAPR